MIQVFLLIFSIVSPREGGAISRDFTTILAPECRAFRGALKIEKLKAPLISGPEGAVDTNVWCINVRVDFLVKLKKSDISEVIALF